jgi:hypothetical protein
MTKKDYLKAVIKAAKQAALATIILLVAAGYFGKLPDNRLIIFAPLLLGFYILRTIHRRL